MKMIKKIGALVMVLALVLALGVTALADDITFTDGVAGAFSSANKDVATVDSDKSITLHKELTAYNPDSSEVHAPEITYTYTITAGDAGKTIIDDPAVHNSGVSSKILTKAGPIAGLSVTGALNKAANTPVVAGGSDTSVANTIQFTTAGTLTTAADGAANTSDLKIDFSGVSYAAAGVYRYVITETVSAYESNGVVDGDGGETTQVRYLDVYVKDGASAGTYDIYGYVCFKVQNDAIDFNTSGSVAAAEKTDGFVDTDTSAADASNADKYYTFDVQIKKSLVNDQANNNHQFPFKVTFANTKVTSNVLLTVAQTGTVTVPTPAAAAISGTVYDGKDGAATNQIKIAKDGEVKLIGIPAGTTVTIAEYNDVVGTTYKVKTEKGTSNIDPAVALEWNNWSSNITAVGGTANTNSKVAANFTNTNEITFTNTLEVISPTGIALRIAPYALILAAGLAIFFVTRKRKIEE